LKPHCQVRLWRAKTLGAEAYSRLAHARLTPRLHRRWAHLRLAEAAYYGAAYGGGDADKRGAAVRFTRVHSRLAAACAR
jgi:hypothetical protein